MQGNSTDRDIVVCLLLFPSGRKHQEYYCIPWFLQKPLEYRYSVSSSVHFLDTTTSTTAIQPSWTGLQMAKHPKPHPGFARATESERRMVQKLLSLMETQSSNTIHHRRPFLPMVNQTVQLLPIFTVRV